MAEIVSPESLSEAMERRELRQAVERNYLNFMLQLSQRQVPDTSSSSSKQKDVSHKNVYA